MVDLLVDCRVVLVLVLVAAGIVVRAVRVVVVMDAVDSDGRLVVLVVPDAVGGRAVLLVVAAGIVVRAAVRLVVTDSDGRLVTVLLVGARVAVLLRVVVTVVTDAVDGRAVLSVTRLVAAEIVVRAVRL